MNQALMAGKESKVQLVRLAVLGNEVNEDHLEN